MNITEKNKSKAKLDNYDLLIKNGYVIDPKTNNALIANIGIKNGKIVSFTHENIQSNIQESFTSTKEIDAKGKIVTPGFIDFYSHVNGKLHAAKCMVRQGATTTIGGFREFNGKITKQIFEEGFLINHGFCVSHSFTLRPAAGVLNPYRPAMKKEIDSMCALAESFFENGTFGLHFCLEYFPGTSKEELIRLSLVAKKFNSPIIIQLRKCGQQAWKYLDEIFEIASLTGVSVHIPILMYHSGYGFNMDMTLQLIDEQIIKGLDITADSGVYNAFIERVSSRGFDQGWQDDWGGTYEDLLISSGIHVGKYCNKELFDHLRERFPFTMVTAFVCNTWDIPKPLRRPYVYVSTNAADGSHYQGIGHPEVAGTFPKLISNYVRETNFLEIKEAIKKITYLPAQRFAIKNKGWIGVGADADIVVFDFEKIKDHADYLGSGLPDAPPSGIDYVIVGGEIVVENNYVYEDKRPGKLLFK